MFEYFFSFDRENHLIHTRIALVNTSEEPIELRLAAWRPGRYQLQNFPKNLLNFQAKQAGQPLPWKKKDGNTWEVFPQAALDFEVEYSFYAYDLNAGSSLVHRDYLYLNPINFTLFTGEMKDFRVHLSTDGEVACGLPYTTSALGVSFTPPSLYTWFDSPMIIGKQLQHHRFEAEGVPFHLWIRGRTELPIPLLLKDLKAVASYQIRLFGEFPEPDFHFLLLVPPHSYYHGVEHARSTVMVLGENGLLGPSSYQDLLGLASHELFHAWNICKIRPAELLPYDYTRENYFETCFVAEGMTTYFGDRVLLDAGVFTPEQYRFELEATLRRHFDHAEPAAQSLLESSFDLWVDGYELGVPGKKVSVYHKGAIAALILDAKLRAASEGKVSLEDLMRALYQRFGDLQTGYTYTDIVLMTKSISSAELDTYFADYIAGTRPIFDEAQEALAHFGLLLERSEKTVVLSLKEPQ